MTEPDRLDRNRLRLQDCHAVFRDALARVLDDLHVQGFRPRIQDSWRSTEEELKAYTSGRSQVRRGFHSITDVDGLPAALAADVLDDDHPLAPARPYLLALTRAARAHGLNTGLLWGLPSATRIKINAALAAGTDWAGVVGWDPTHCECTGLTIAEAITGQRPTPMT